MQLTGIHHRPAFRPTAPGNHAFYTGRPRHAAREKDREPGRSAPITCSTPTLGEPRHRPHLLRLARGPRTAWKQHRHAPGCASGSATSARVLERPAEQTRRDAWRHRQARRPPDARFRGSRGPAADARRRWRSGRGAPVAAAPCPPSTRSAGLGRSR